MKKKLINILDYVLDHPLNFIIASSVIFIFAGLLIPLINVDSSVDVFFNKKGANYINFQEWKEQFGSDQEVVVALDTENVFTQENLELIQELTSAFESLEYVDNVTSLTTVNTTIGERRDFIVRRLVEEIPETDAALASLRETAIQDPLYVKNVISPDGKVAAIIIELNEAEENAQNDSKKETIIQIQEILAATIPEDISYHISGLAAIEYFYAAYMQEDFKAFMPFLFLMIIFVMYASFRSWKLVALPMFAIIVSVTISMSLLYIFGFSLNNVTAIIPPILMAIMIADSVHVIGDALDRSRKFNAGTKETLRQAMLHLCFPCFLTTATTAVGFWSLALSGIPPVRQLGIIVGFGVVIALIITATFLPSVAIKWGAFESPKEKQVNAPALNHIEKVLTYLSGFNQRYHKSILVAAVVISVISFWGVTKIKAETSVIEYFRPTTKVYQATIFIEERLSGVHTLNVSLQTEAGDYFKNPVALKDIQQITRYLEEIPEVDKIISVNDYLKKINKSFNQENPEFYKLPESQRMVSQYVLLYGREDLEDFVDDQWQWATISVRLKEHSTVKLEGVIENIREYLNENFSGKYDAKVLGQTVLEAESNNTVFEGQMKSLGLAMLVIFAMMFFVFRSLAIGLISVVPNVLPILMNFGIMGWFGIRLDSATSMIAAVGIGIIVDDTIHFLYGFGESLRGNTHQDYINAIFITMKSKGRPIVLTSMILFFGFGILSVSKFIPTAYFGLLSAILMLNALIADLFVLPSILIWLKPPYSKGENK